MSIAEKLTTIAENEQKVYEAGKQKEWSDFWDSVQQNGERTDYNYAFRTNGWADSIFKPKYDISPTTANAMFLSARIEDLKGCLERQGVMLDTSQCTNFTQFTQGSKIKYLPEIDVRNGTAMGHVFYNGNLISIDKLIVSENAPFLNTTFQTASSLERLIVEGTIGQNGLNLQWSTKLDKDSITSIINALSSETSGLSVTLSKTAVNSAFGIDVDDDTTWAEGEEFYNLRHSKDNWTISYV